MDLHRACDVWDFLAKEYDYSQRQSAGNEVDELPGFNVRMDSSAMLSCLKKLGWYVKNEISEGGSIGLVSVKSFHRDASRYCQGAKIQWENQSQYPLALARAVDSAIEALKGERFL